MRPKDAEPTAITGGHPARVAGGTIGVAIFLGRFGADMDERAIEVRVADMSQEIARGPTRGNGGQAALNVASMLLDVEVSQGFNRSSLGRIEVSPSLQVIG